MPNKIPTCGNSALRKGLLMQDWVFRPGMQHFSRQGLPYALYGLIRQSYLSRYLRWGDRLILIDGSWSLNDLTVGGVHKLHWPNFAHSRPPTYPWLTFVREFFNTEIRENLHTVDIYRIIYQLCLVNVVYEWPLQRFKLYIIISDVAFSFWFSCNCVLTNSIKVN